MFQNEQRITITARDLKVVSALQCDGRMTMQALADKIGISVYAATESYRRLTESGIMSIVGVQSIESGQLQPGAGGTSSRREQG